MEQQIPDNLRQALESDCATDLSEVIRDRDQASINALRRHVSLDSSIRPEHRTKALYALGRLGDTDSVRDILSVLPHLDEKGRISAIDALGRIGTREAASGVLQHTGDESQDVRMMVTRALRRINTAESIRALRNMAENDSADSVRTAASRRIANGDRPRNQ